MNGLLEAFQFQSVFLFQPYALNAFLTTNICTYFESLIKGLLCLVGSWFLPNDNEFVQNMLKFAYNLAGFVLNMT